MCPVHKMAHPHPLAFLMMTFLAFFLIYRLAAAQTSSSPLARSAATCWWHRASSLVRLENVQY